MSTPWTSSIKQLTPYRHPERPANTAPPSHAFTAPTFGLIKLAPLDLFKSIARCSALSRSSPSLIAALTASSRALLEFLIDDPPVEISFIEDVIDLADAERTALAGRIGAGITDQTMEMLGYVWRDIAEELIGSSAPLADFVYENSAGNLVLAEAKGSVTIGATQAGAGTRARNSYHRQVDPYVYTSPAGAKGKASVGFIDHGYAVAFAALPEQSISGIAADAFLAVAETDPSAPVPKMKAPTSGTAKTTSFVARRPPLGQHNPQSFPLRLGNYRAVFLLANAAAVVEAIDLVLADSEPREVHQTFVRVRCGERDFLIGDDPVFEPISDLAPYLKGWTFAIALETAEKFLEQLRNPFNPNVLRGLPVLPSARVTGKNLPPFLLSPDGFAMIQRAKAKIIGEDSWSIGTGLRSSPVDERSLLDWLDSYQRSRLIT